MRPATAAVQEAEKAHASHPILNVKISQNSLDEQQNTVKSPAAYQRQRRSKHSKELQFGSPLAANTAYMHVIKEPYESILRR